MKNNYNTTLHRQFETKQLVHLPVIKEWIQCVALPSFKIICTLLSQVL